MTQCHNNYSRGYIWGVQMIIQKTYINTDNDCKDIERKTKRQAYDLQLDGRNVFCAKTKRQDLQNLDSAKLNIFVALLQKVLKVNLGVNSGYQKGSRFLGPTQIICPESKTGQQPQSPKLARAHNHYDL